MIGHEKNTYPAIVHKDELGGYWVSCPTFKRCYGQGESIEEALSGIREAIELCKEEQKNHSRARVIQGTKFDLSTNLS